MIEKDFYYSVGFWRDYYYPYSIRTLKPILLLFTRNLRKETELQREALEQLIKEKSNNDKGNSRQSSPFSISNM